jgi:hypothetical protein
VRGAAQQLDADEALERAHLAAERRLGDVQACGGASEVQLLGDRDERAQVPDLDRVGRLREGEQAVAVVHAGDYGRPAPIR